MFRYKDKMKSKKIEKFENRHNVISFLIIFILTIFLTRIITYIKDPNIIIQGYKLHHFYYGLVLLIIINLVMLFGKEKYSIYLTLSAVSMGLIADELFFILGNLADSQYSSTFPEAIFSGLAILLMIFLIELIRGKVK